MCSCRSGFQLASDGRGCNGEALSRYAVFNLPLAVVGFNAWSCIIVSPQTSMSVALTMVDVLTTAPTPRALLCAAAEVDSS